MATFWDEFKDLFKTKNQKDEERASKLSSALESERQITDELDRLENEYQSYLNENKEEEPDLESLFPSSLGLEKIEYTPESDESIASRADAEITAEKTKETNKVADKYDSAISELDEEKADTAENRAVKEKEIAELYAQLKKNQQNDSIKKGVARGSIMSSLLQQLESGEQVNKTEVARAYYQAIDDIDKTITSLNLQKDTALNELDLKYAAKLEKEIAELKAERDKTVASYTKYNNNVEEKERKYAQSREEDVAKYLEQQKQDRLQKQKEQREYEAKYGYSGEKLQNYSQRYNVAYEFYMSLDGDIAADALAASPTMKFYLGNYYDKLMGELEGREGAKKKYY